MPLYDMYGHHRMYTGKKRAFHMAKRGINFSRNAGINVFNVLKVARIKIEREKEREKERERERERKRERERHLHRILYICTNAYHLK